MSSKRWTKVCTTCSSPSSRQSFAESFLPCSSSAEKAYATIRNPKLSISKEEDGADPTAQAKPRLIKQLPHGTEDADVYELFRPYGALAQAQRILTNPTGHVTGFRGMALVVYYSEEDAAKAQAEMHCAEIEGKTISVSIDNVARRPNGGNHQEFSPAAQPFVPSFGAGAGNGNGRGMNATAPAFQPPLGSPSSLSSAQQQQPGPIVAVPGTNLQYSASAATYIDPCNLFCKNLDPALDSNDLFTMFKTFGRIVSARVMRDDQGVSREFGFVSYTNPDDAAKALNAMNNTMQGSKLMTVRLHEPKRVRQDKLSHKFGTQYRNPSASPHLSDEGSPTPSPGTKSPAMEKREKRGSNSYFKAAIEGNSSTVDADQLRAMSGSVRNDIVRGEFSRRVAQLPGIDQDDVEGLVTELCKLRLPDAVEALNSPPDLIKRVSDLQTSGVTLSSTSDSGAAGGAATLSVPTPGSGVTSAADNISINSAAPASAKERERILKAVSGIMSAGAPVEDVTDMIVSLSKKDRAMALFNPDFLRQKVDEAKDILDITDEDESPSNATNGNGASTAAVASKSTEKAPAAHHTLASLARLPAKEIIRLATEPASAASPGLPLPKADPEVVKSTDAFIDGLQDKPIQDQKQKVGDQLYKKIKAFGIKGAPKITITLLDSEDLRSLAHLINSYPDCLKEKVELVAGQKQ